MIHNYYINKKRKLARNWWIELPLGRTGRWVGGGGDPVAPPAATCAEYIPQLPCSNRLYIYIYTYIYIYPCIPMYPHVSSGVESQGGPGAAQLMPPPYPGGDTEFPERGGGG